MWTVKEAYTKALGLGMGFEFSRVEFDAVQRQIKIDGKTPKGWKFTLFTIPDADDLYEGVAAEFVGGDGSQVHDEVAKDCSSWLTVVDALSVLQRAVDELPSILSLVYKSGGI
jgi:4'-phosphopantetheinyl transferase